MNKSPRRLYSGSFAKFNTADANAAFGELCGKYHGDALTTTREAWTAEIAIMKQVLFVYSDDDGQIVFE